MRKRKPVLLNGKALMADGKPLEFDAVDQEELDGKIDAPQTAAVGEVLTVEEVDADGKPKKWKTQTVAAGQKQADMAQNDPTKPDYILNRPGGYYDDPVTVDEEIYSGEIEQRGVEILVDWLLVAGKAYKVIIGEEEKTYTAFADSFNGFHGVTIGDATLEEAVGSEEMFALMSVDLEGEKGALIVFPNADVGKTIRVTTETQKREVHKIPMELLDLGGVDENIKRTNAALNALNDKHTSDISAINKMLTEGPITFKRGSTTLKLGDYNANDGLMLRWDYGNGSYTYVYRDGLYVNNVSAGTSIGMNAYTINIVEKAHNSGIRFNLEKTDANGGTRFSVENVAGVRTTFYASGKIINSNRLLQLSASSTITEDNATTLRGVKTPEQEYDAANKKYVDQRLPSPATAQVGQIVKVKAVDADGKITETEAVDIPSVSNDYELVFQETVAEDAYMYSRDTDKDGNPFSLTDVMVIIFTKPFAESTNSYGRALGFLPTSKWGHDAVLNISNSIKSGGNDVGCYDVAYVKVINGYQICDRYYRSQNTTNVFGIMQERTGAGETGVQFHNDATKIMEISRPQGNITCVKIVGYTNPLVSAGTIIALYKKKGT